MKITNNKYYAFFDVDGTLLKGKPMLNFLRFYYKKSCHRYPFIGDLKYYLFRVKAALLKLLNGTREAQNKLYYKNFKHQKIVYIASLGYTWFKDSINDNSYWNTIVDELNFHKSNGAEIVLVSGSFSACLNNIVNKLNPDYILATSLEVQGGRYTGNLLSEPVIGDGKSNIILQFLHEHQFYDLYKCFAYGDHISDLQMLSLVGNPVVVAGDAKLEQIAANKFWRVVYPI